MEVKNRRADLVFEAECLGPRGDAKRPPGIDGNQLLSMSKGSTKGTDQSGKNPWFGSRQSRK